MSEALVTTVCFVLVVLYLQKRDKRRGTNHLRGTNDDSVGGGDESCAAVKARKDDQDDAG